MTIRERIVAAYRGHLPDRIPWTIYRGLLPKTPAAEALQKKGLGLFLSAAPYSAATPNVKYEDREAVEDGAKVRYRTYRTPVGALTQKWRIETGYGSGWTKEYPVKGAKDYEVLEFIVRDTVYRPNFEGFLKAERDMGDAGIVLAPVERPPFQKLWILYAGLERVVVDLHEDPGPVERVLKAMFEKQLEMFRIIADSPAEFVWCPDNITGAVAGPPIFKRYMMPHYDALDKVLHPKGKRLVSHMDGMMRCLVECVRQTTLDVIEAFTPPPDGNLPLNEALAAWPDKTVSINFPSSVHLAKPEDVRAATLELLDQAGDGRRFVMGVTENIPADVWERSLGVITDTLAEHGRCPLP
jgi:hypothetical protein